VLCSHLGHLVAMVGSVEMEGSSMMVIVRSDAWLVLLSNFSSFVDLIYPHLRHFICPPEEINMLLHFGQNMGTTIVWVG
jgi:hypothetical protein